MGGLGNENHNKNKDLSAAAKERREEEKRRLRRKNDVVIGKTSAKPDEKDYNIDPVETERQWRVQASDTEREVAIQTDRGMDCLRMLQLEEAAEAFDKVYEMKPNAYLWQAGVVKYYLDDYSGAAECFAHNAAVFESKFGSPASEERIWKDACELKLLSLQSRRDRAATKAAMFQSQRQEGDEMSTETRKVIRIARDLFSASVHNDYSTVALSRAKLRSICGDINASAQQQQQQQARIDRKMWKLNSWYYLGLHYDALGEEENSKSCMKMALRQCATSVNGNDIIQTLPVLHMARRDWYDDDDFEADDDLLELSSNRSDSASEVLMKSLTETLDKMKVAELQDALKKRGLKFTGTKSALQKRLLWSLLDDAGLGKPS